MVCKASFYVLLLIVEFKVKVLKVGDCSFDIWKSLFFFFSLCRFNILFKSLYYEERNVYQV